MESIESSPTAITAETRTPSARSRRPSPLARTLALLRDCRRAALRYDATSLAVAARLLRLFVKEGFTPREALQAGLGDPRISRARFSGCVSGARFDRMQGRVNRLRRDATEDKGPFYIACQSLGVPVPRLCAIFERGVGFSADGRVLSRRPEWETFFATELPEQFVIKPVNGAYGRGLSAFQRSAGGFLDSSGAVRTPTALFDWLVSQRRYRRFVIQERIRNHSLLVELSGTEALQTLRIHTFVEEDGSTRAYSPEMKLIVGDNLMDNFHFGRTGNLLGLVGKEGVLGPVLALSPDGIGLVEVTHHPRTGAPLAGVRVPFFAETVALVERIAPLFLPLRAIGWDVAATPEGPVIVEGNMWFDPPTLLVPRLEPDDVDRSTETLLARMRSFAHGGRA